MAAEGGDDDHISPSRGDDIAANHIFRAIIAPLEDKVRLQRGDQLQRGVCD